MSDKEPSYSVVSGNGKQTIGDLGDSLHRLFEHQLMSCIANPPKDNVPEKEWITKLRDEANKASIKDIFWLSRDQVYELIGTRPPE